ncbi:hypothetical protein [Psychroserpens mesophilus]|uniref:hypothetical protein n=1 Tax=Psychroserpens mesophilus TaxID=325473 RepID=UPI003D65533E
MAENVNITVDENIEEVSITVDESVEEVSVTVSENSNTSSVTNTSELTNDGEDGVNPFISGYTVTESDVTTHQSALSITESQISDLSHFSGDYNDLSNQPTIPSDNYISDVTLSGDTLQFTGNESGFNGDVDLSSLSGGGGSTNPAGNDTEIQFNDGGSFGSSSNLTYDGSTLDVDGSVKTNTLESDEGVTIPEGAFSSLLRSQGSQIQTIYNPDHNMLYGNGTNGYMIIKTPLIEGNNYSAFNIEVEIGGQYSSSLKMNISVRWLTSGFDILNVYSTSSELRNYTVRCGKDADGKTYIIIGDSTTNWNRYYIKINSVTSSYIYDDIEVFKQGWVISQSVNLPAGFIQNEILTNTDLIVVNTGISKGTFVPSNNTWHTVAQGDLLCFEGDIIVKRLDQATMSFRVAKSYSNRFLKLNFVEQFSSNAFQGIRMTTDNKIQIKWGSYNTTTMDLFINNNNDGGLSLADEEALSGDTVSKVIEFTGINESGEIHYNDIETKSTVKAETLNLSNVPTSSSGLSSGDVWNDSGILKIV